ncbi:MAG: transcription-repair coupling factor [Thermoguttaceae bacterium]
MILPEIFGNRFGQPCFAGFLSQLESGHSVALDGVSGSVCALIAAIVAEQMPGKTLLLLYANSEPVDRMLDDLAFFGVQSPVAFPQLQNLHYATPLYSSGQRNNEFFNREITENQEQIGNNDVLSGRDDFPALFAPFSDDLFGQRLRLLKRLDEKTGNETRRHGKIGKNVGKDASKNVNGDESKNVEGKKKTGEPNSPGSPRIIVSSIAALLQPVPDSKTLHERSRFLRVGDSLDPKDLVRWLLEGGYHATSGVDLPGEYAIRGSLLDIFPPDEEQPIRVEFFGDEIESIRRFDLATQRSLESIPQIGITRVRADEQFTSCLTDYLPSETIVLLVEPDDIEKAAREYIERSECRNALHSASEVLKQLFRFPQLSLATLNRGYSDSVFEMPFETVERLQGDLATLKTVLNELDDEIWVICPTDAEIKRLTETFSETKASATDRLRFQTGLLTSGFRLLDSPNNQKGEDRSFAINGWTRSLVVIGSGQLFQRTAIRRVRSRKLGQVIDSFLELKPGDLIVHLAHGIGRFRGLKTLIRSQQEEEHLELEFADDARLFVPTSKIALVQKYVGGTSTKPVLAKLGGVAWSKQKKAVQEAVFDLAVEMIDLQAARESYPGIPFPADSDWQLEFDAEFPYNETEDQLQAIDAIKADMQLSRPMDRLICGDVGFGKTEVAMRAAFKAADAGFQVAILVPTTILAEQHYRTFSERMREFPFTIAALSRFQTKKEQMQIAQGLQFGSVDIVIGTHRLVSKDIQFHNLGLVIIDEEQRFGVEHKERLKTLRKTVDVLTLSATPIPRTLHFSLVGLRDISNLETPPEDRMSVETRLVRYHPELIRSALLRELRRGGQAFFVHNRVKDIEMTAEKISRIVPEARIGIGHAQMPEHELETVMRAFVRQEFDVLVCTTIIESGLDIPNANTIFIDRADLYGLSELHQLRGRVGRYKNQAYCYLLIDANQPLTPIAAKRLRVIEEFSHLGAGFSIAMRDLEIRGAGNILGTQQSGHIATVGYEMYCQFLEGAVRTLKQMPQKTVIDVELELPGKALIPKSYIPDQRSKIDLYRRMMRIMDETQLQEIRAEIQDRFGRPPKEVLRLLEQAQIRIAAHHFRIRHLRLESVNPGDPTLSQNGGYLVLDYVSKNKIEELQDNWTQNRLQPIGPKMPYIRSKERIFRIIDSKTAYIALPQSVGGPNGDPAKILRFIQAVFGIDPIE